MIRRLHLEDDTLVVPRKSAVVGSIDDVTADRRYEVEVTATKVKVSPLPSPLEGVKNRACGHLLLEMPLLRSG